MADSSDLRADQGDLLDKLEARVRSGAYESTEDVLNAALNALEREEAAANRWLQREIEKTLSDPRPNTDAVEVFARLRRRHGLPETPVR